MPDAVLAHSFGVRARLRFPGRAGDAAFLKELAARAGALEDVVHVEPRPESASLVVIHVGDFGALAAAAEVAGVFRIAAPVAERPEIPLHFLAQGLVGRLDRVIERHSEGVIDLRDASSLALVAMALLQLARGNVATPATTALWYGLSLLLSDRRTPRR
ncbi:hypothetical protein [Minwuia thermotolerans]|uniref:Uncharacterized protein n=1 Tax=Minwuia thermotolerans TaxID=2056226 RepID=A0A2M9G3D9_9PROT|nr:hypothetical protein [Minwuia thermotolerans]PJK30196.1 hypothetical protein CVT23_07285 [Minwuia thermotolerans]